MTFFTFLDALPMSTPPMVFLWFFLFRCRIVLEKHVSDISLRVEAFSVGDKCDTVTVSTRLFLICRLKRRNFCW
jgi:hypothetical protein